MHVFIKLCMLLSDDVQLANITMITEHCNIAKHSNDITNQVNETYHIPRT